MADNVKPTFAKSGIKSGLENEKYLDTVLDGQPPTKDVKQIDKENQVKNCPGTAGV